MNFDTVVRTFIIGLVAASAAIGVFLFLLRQPSEMQFEKVVAANFQAEPFEEINPVSVVQQEKNSISDAEIVQPNEDALRIDSIKKAPIVPLVAIQPDKKKRIIIRQKDCQEASKQRISKPEEKVAEQLKEPVENPSDSSLSAQETPPEMLPRLQVTNLLAIMDGQDAGLMDKAFETAPSHAFFAWDNNLSGYTFEIVLQPAYTNKKGSICRPGSIMAWKEPQTLTTLYQQQEVTGCRMAKTSWFVR